MNQQQQHKNKKQDLIINFYKPSGISSAQALNVIKKICHVKKAGYAGTLDPMASGILLIGTNKATKNLNKLTNSDKAYYVEVLFGIQTDTGDITGNVTKESENLDFDQQTIDAALNSFNLNKDYNQTVPKYSAIKINGVRAYKLARQKIEFDQPKRPVKIFAIKQVAYAAPQLGLIISVSKGFYVREFVSELAAKLNTVAVATKIVRIKCDSYLLRHAQTFASLKKNIWTKTK